MADQVSEYADELLVKMADGNYDCGATDTLEYSEVYTRAQRADDMLSSYIKMLEDQCGEHLETVIAKHKAAWGQT